MAYKYSSSKGFIVILWVLVLVGIGYGLYWLLTKPPALTSQEQPAPQEEVPIPKENRERETAKPSGDVLKLILQNPDIAKTAELKAVDKSSSFGIGYRLSKAGVFSHAVTALLQDPPQGVVYEGWLVQQSPLQFFSTGVMAKDPEGKWILEYTANQDFPSYTKVVITTETKVDGIPETHILEGEFQ